MNDQKLRDALYSRTVTHGYHVHGPERRDCPEYVVGQCGLAAVPEPALNVERLAEALHWRVPGCEANDRDSCLAWATAIAARYARLSDPSNG